MSNFVVNTKLADGSTPLGTRIICSQNDYFQFPNQTHIIRTGMWMAYFNS